MSNRPSRKGRRTLARSTHAAASAAYTLESLEPRALLSGVTVIAHGAELFSGLGSSSRPGWIDAMGQAIAARYGGNTAIYALRIEPGGSGAVKVTSFNRLSGAANSAAGTSGETVLLLDWAAASNVSIGALKADYSSTLIANAALPYLTTAMPALGITAPLAEGAVQLIGHSRGGSVISELAKGLGAAGIWLDQVTFLDPRPVPSDPLTINLTSNILFADNYYQNSGDGFFTPNGIKVNGAVNTGPLDVSGTGLGSTHNNIVLFYQGTIDTSAGASIQSSKVPGSWYTGNSLNRGAIGFYWAHAGGGAWARPAGGLSAAFGGSASRTSVTRTGTQWANIGTLNVSATTLAPMQAFTASFRYNSYNAAATVLWYLDPDTNPYNNNSLAIGASSLVATGDAPMLSAAALSAVAPYGTYFLEARISNGGTSRYAYSSALTLANVSPVGSIDIAGPAVLQGWVVDPDNKAAAVNVRLDVDGVTLATVPANVARQDLVAAFGSANHGYSFDLTGLAKGTHKVELYGLDTATGSASLIASKLITTNLTPIGNIDWFDGSILAGWALDPDALASAVQIRYTIDNHAPVLLTANATRGDLTSVFGSAEHGFALVLPQLTAGAHTITVDAVDPVSQAVTRIGTRMATVASPQGNPLPMGSIDVINSTTVAGWTYDPGAAATPISIRVDIDGVAGSPSLASIPRGDLMAAVGSTNHGYNRPLNLTPGLHRIDVYALDAATNASVLLGSRIVGTTVPVGSIDLAGANGFAGWAYSGALAIGGATSAIIRVDIDNLPGAAFTTSLARADITALFSEGTWGYSITPPPLTAGTHTVSLVSIDPLTLVSTTIVTRTITV
jgi:hypothetical protein